MDKGKNKAKRNVISLETKATILKRLAEGERSTALGKEFGFGESTIRGIQKRASQINKSNNYATNESAKRASYSRNILIEKTEKALILWIQELTQKRIPIDGELLKEKAIQFYNQLKYVEPSCSLSHIERLKFSASNGWLVGFLQRHALHNLKIKGETASADETAAKNYCKVLAKVIEDGEYCPDQVFNADETGLFWKKMPSRTFITKSEKIASGFKAAKVRVTFLLCSNASGARMLKPLMINRSLHPRALKGKNIAELPVHFMANKKAWVTTAAFITWFNDCFVPEVRQYMSDIGLPFNVLLIVDNAPGHPCIEHPNVKVVFLPPNTTSLIQPLDQGIIAAFKKHYVKLTFRYILEKLENDAITLTEVWKKFSILDCINHAAAAIIEIKQHTLNACWKAAWPECVINRNVTENTSKLTTEIITLAQSIGGDGFNTFSEDDLVEMIQDEAVRDNDILNYVTDVTDRQEEPDCMTADKIYAGLQLCHKLECHFLAIDNNSERSSEFQKQLHSCISGYRDLYKRLVKQQSSQRLITDYVLTEKKPTLNECEVVSSSEESDFEPVYHKKVRVLSDNEG